MFRSIMQGLRRAFERVIGRDGVEKLLRQMEEKPSSVKSDALEPVEDAVAALTHAGFSQFMREGRFRIMTGTIYLYTDEKTSSAFDGFLADVFNFAAVAKGKGVDLDVYGLVHSVNPDGIPDCVRSIKAFQKVAYDSAMPWLVQAQLGAGNPEYHDAIRNAKLDVAICYGDIIAGFNRMLGGSAYSGLAKRPYFQSFLCVEPFIGPQSRNCSG